MVALNAGVLALSSVPGANSSGKVGLTSLSNRISLAQIATVGTSSRSFCTATSAQPEAIDHYETTWERHPDAQEYPDIETEPLPSEDIQE